MLNIDKDENGDHKCTGVQGKLGPRQFGPGAQLSGAHFT